MTPASGPRRLDERLEQALDDDDVVRALTAVHEGADVNVVCRDGGFTLAYLLLEHMSVSTNTPETLVEELPQPSELVQLFQSCNGIYKLNYAEALKYVAQRPTFKLVLPGNTSQVLHTFAMTFFRPEIDVDRLCAVLVRGRTGEELNAKNKKQHTAFMTSVLHKTPQRLCLARHPDIDVNVTLSCNSLLAARNLPRGVSASIRGWGRGEPVIQSGFSPLMIAVLLRDEQLLNTLLSRPDLVSSTKMRLEVDDVRKITPGDSHMHLAVVNGDVALLKFMLRSVGPEALKRVNTLGENMLHVACNAHHRDIVLMLLDKDELRGVFEPQVLTDEAVSEFVNHVSSEEDTGRAASCFTYNVQSPNDESYVILKAFVECLEYDFLAVDQSGNSLLHHVVETGHADLLRHLAEKPTANFEAEDCRGRTPLLIAIDSGKRESVQVIEELARLAADRNDLKVNKHMDQFCHLEAKLLSLRHEFGGCHWNTSRMAEVYLKQVDKTPLEVTINEARVEATIMSSGLPSHEKTQLEEDISECLSEIRNESYYSARPYMTRPALDVRAQAVRAAVGEKYAGNTCGSFCISHGGAQLEVAYSESERAQKREIEVRYELLVEHMGQEWDYRQRSEDQLPSKYIMSLTHKPPLYLVLQRIENAREKELELSKLRALLTFPYVTIPCVDDAVHGQVNMVRMANNVCEEAARLLELKLTTQACGSRVDADACVDYVIPWHAFLSTQRSPYDALRKYKLSEYVNKCPPPDDDAEVKKYVKIMSNEVKHSPKLLQKLIFAKSARKVSELLKLELPAVNELKRCKQLYSFAVDFITRANSVTAYRSNHQVDRTSRLLDAMARVIEADSVCVALCFMDDVFVIASNCGGFDWSSAQRAAVRARVSEAARQLFQYIADCIGQEKAVEHAERSVAILEYVLTYYWALNEEGVEEQSKKRKGSGTDFLKNGVLKCLIEFCYAECDKICKLTTINKDGNAIFDRAFAYIKEHFQGPEGRHLPEKARDFVYRIYRLTRDMHKMREGVGRRIFTRQMRKAILDKNCKILANEESIHAETELIINAVRGATQRDVYVGISKVCCCHCSLFIQSFNNRCFKDVYIGVRGSHVFTYSWRVPKYLVENVDKLAAFLGGRKSTLYHNFASMDQENKILALKLVEDISDFALKDKKMTYLFDLVERGTMRTTGAEQSVSDVMSPSDEQDLSGFHDDGSLFEEWCLAIQLDDVERLLQLVTSCGVNVNWREFRGHRTALHVAAATLNVRLVQELMARQARVDCRDAEGMTPEQRLPSFSEHIVDLLHPLQAEARKTQIQESKSFIENYKRSHDIYMNVDELTEIVEKFQYDKNYESDAVYLDYTYTLMCIISSIDHIAITLKDVEISSYVSIRTMTTLLNAIGVGSWHLIFRVTPAASGAVWRLFSFLFFAENISNVYISSPGLIQLCLEDMLRSGHLESWRNRLVACLQDRAVLEDVVTEPLLYSTLSYIADMRYLAQMEVLLSNYVSRESLLLKRTRSRWLSCVVRLGEALEDASSNLRGRFDADYAKKTIELGCRISVGDIAGEMMDYIAGVSDVHALQHLETYWKSVHGHIKIHEKEMSKKYFSANSSVLNEIMTIPAPEYLDRYESAAAHASTRNTQTLLCQYIDVALEVQDLCDYSQHNLNVLGYVLESNIRKNDDEIIEVYHRVLEALAKRLLQAEEFTTLVPDMEGRLKLIIDDARVLLPENRMFRRQEGRFFKTKEELLEKYHATCRRISATLPDMKAALYYCATDCADFKAAVEAVGRM